MLGGSGGGAVNSSNNAALAFAFAHQGSCCCASTVRSTVGSKMAVTQIIGSVCWSWELRREEGGGVGGGWGWLGWGRFWGVWFGRGLWGLDCRMGLAGCAQEGKMELGRGCKWRGYYLMRGASGFRRNH